jgi:hypothetical protein
MFKDVKADLYWTGEMSHVSGTTSTVLGFDGIATDETCTLTLKSRM